LEAYGKEGGGVMLTLGIIYLGMVVFVLAMLQKNNGWPNDYEEVCCRLGIALLWFFSLPRDAGLGIANLVWEKREEAKRKARQKEEDEELH
jgi:hypothetical protein